MAVIDTLYKILPENLFRFLSKKHYQALSYIYPHLSETAFRKLLIDKLHIKSGTTVFIHSSIDKLNIGFPVYNVLYILLDVVGEEGTLVFPSWHYIGRAEDYAKKTDSVFNVKKSPTFLGLLPELARRHKDAFRSLHPTTSIVAIGKHAQMLVSEHHLDIYPQGEKSPFYKMIELDAQIIGLGEKVVSLSFVHCVEDVMKEQFPFKTLKDEVFDCHVIDNDRKIISVKTKVAHPQIQNRDIVSYVKNNISLDICKTFKYNGVNFFSCSAYHLFYRMEELAMQKATIYEGELIMN